MSAQESTAVQQVADDASSNADASSAPASIEDSIKGWHTLPKYRMLAIRFMLASVVPTVIRTAWMSLVFVFGGKVSILAYATALLVLGGVALMFAAKPGEPGESVLLQKISATLFVATTMPASMDMYFYAKLVPEEQRYSTLVAKYLAAAHDATPGPLQHNLRIFESVLDLVLIGALLGAIINIYPVMMLYNRREIAEETAAKEAAAAARANPKPLTLEEVRNQGQTKKLR